MNYFALASSILQIFIKGGRREQMANWNQTKHSSMNLSTVSAIQHLNRVLLEGKCINKNFSVLRGETAADRTQQISEMVLLKYFFQCSRYLSDSPHSVDSLFTQKMVSFVIQNLFSFTVCQLLVLIPVLIRKSFLVPIG